MRIRTITCFINPKWPLEKGRLQAAAEFLAAAKERLISTGEEVQTTRLATIPFPDLLPDLEQSRVVELAVELENQTIHSGIEYISIGPAAPDRLESYTAIPDVIAMTKNVFISGSLTTHSGGISLPAVRLCAEALHKASQISPDGFANLRFAALANVPPGVPFLPAGYAEDGPPAFALGLEAADLAVQAVSSATSIREARSSLVEAIEQHANRLTKSCLELERRLGFSFKGLDFTLAPFPDERHSIGAALEGLGVPAIGLHGSLAGSALLTEALDRANFRRTGFNGLFLPVLEDSVLAQRAAEGILSVRDLLLCSAVCGTGLDTVPLPGDTSAEQIAALLLDVAALALRLDKPLTARLMPIPGKAAGDPTGFDFAFFANSRVMGIEAAPLRGLFNGDEVFEMRSRLKR
jgi:uncharacterized protein (UPF0210 family)